MTPIDKTDPALTTALLEIGRLFLLTTPRDFSLTSFSALATLVDHGPCRITALAEQEGITQPSMSDLIRRLENTGLVTRSQDPRDARAVKVRATKRGVEVVRRRRQFRSNQFWELLSKLDERDLLILNQAVPALQKLLNVANAKLDRTR